MSTGRTLDRALADVGELVARNERARGRDFAPFERDPVGFITDVLRGDPWPAQERIALAVRDHPLVTVRSCHAAGKDWLAARLALWWVYARGGLVVLTGPTAAQIEEILMRGEVRGAFVDAGLPGELHVRALRPGGTGEAGILARTASDTHSRTGHHHPAGVLYNVTEAQDPDIDGAWDAAFAVCTGAEDRVLTVGNPTEPDGRFRRAHEPGSGWHAVKIAAEDVPNVRQGRTVVPGLLSREGVERFRREYGEGSPVYLSRVLAEFPTVASDGLVRREWLDAAAERWRTGALEHETLDPDHPGGVPYVLGVDPARLGPDSTAVCLRQGPVVRGFETWRGVDTMETADRVRGIVARILDAGGRVEGVHVDEIGLGAGALDRLAETLPRLRWTEVRTGVRDDRVRYRSPAAVGFSASQAAGLPERFRNRRAQAFWRLRKLLEDDRLALPPDERLEEELLAVRVRFASDGRTEIEGKDALKARLGRSPDRADALVISLAPMLREAGRTTVLWNRGRTHTTRTLTRRSR